MVNVHVLSNARTPRGIGKRFALGAIVATAIVVLVAAALGSHGKYSGEGITQASASTRQPASEQSTGPSSAFDYFPDRYKNQATEPAEPIATF